MIGFMESLLQYGSAPAIIVLTALVALLIKRINKNARADERRSLEAQKREETRDKREEGREKSLREFSANLVKEMEARTSAWIRNLQEGQDNLGQRLSCVEREYLPRDEHYRDFSGWRGEIARIVKKIDSFIMVFAKRGGK
jgi:hypothetical protein